MRKFLATVVGGVAVLGAVALPVASGASKSKTIHYTQKITGAEISGTQAVFKIRDSFVGNGAGVQNIKLNSSGTGGTSTTVAYYGDASGTAKGPFKLGTPNAQGVVTVTGSGTSTGGTGKLKGYKAKFTISGTFNTKTLVYQVTVHGTATKH